MNGFESPIYFDALAVGVLVGGILLLLGFVWVIIDRREYEDPLRRRERRERERNARGREQRGEPGTGGVPDAGGARGEDEPRPDGRPGRRRVA